MRLRAKLSNCQAINCHHEFKYGTNESEIFMTNTLRRNNPHCVGATLIVGNAGVQYMPMTD